MSNDIANGYYLRYEKFRNAISAKYPYIVFIGNGVYNGTGWDSNYETDIVDEHYYNSPDFFIKNYGLYDDASRTAHKRYVGEYAVTSNFGNVGNLRAALGEAVFMCGMERNSEAVSMCSYAPIFQNDDLPGWWATEMIHFNNHALFRTPSYYMQCLFPKYLGTENVSVCETDSVSGTAYVNGKLICSVTLNTETSVSERKIYTSANISADEDMIFLRIINPYEEERQVTVNIKNADITTVGGEIVCGDKDDENSWSDTEKVVPQNITALNVNGNAITYTVPVYSANFITIGVENVKRKEDASIGKDIVADRQGEGNIYTLAGVKQQDYSLLAKGIYKNGKIILK